MDYFEPVREAVEMGLGQASTEFNIPPLIRAQLLKNTGFLNPLQFFYTSITSSSFGHSLAVIMFHVETRFSIISQEASYSLHPAPHTQYPR